MCAGVGCAGVWYADICSMCTGVLWRSCVYVCVCAIVCVYAIVYMCVSVCVCVLLCMCTCRSVFER